MHIWRPHGVSRNTHSLVRSLPDRFGGARRDRTADLLNAIQALSQLSYGPAGEALALRRKRVSYLIAWPHGCNKNKGMFASGQALDLVVFAAPDKSGHIRLAFILCFQKRLVLAAGIEGAIFIFGNIGYVTAFDIGQILAFSCGDLFERHKLKPGSACIEDCIVVGVEIIAPCRGALRARAQVVHSLASRTNDWVAVKVVEFTAARLADPLGASLRFNRHISETSSVVRIGAGLRAIRAKWDSQHRRWLSKAKRVKRHEFAQLSALPIDRTAGRGSMTHCKSNRLRRNQGSRPMSQLPPAPQPLTAHHSDGLQGSVFVPGDKSISHRALIFGALAEGRTEIAGLLESEDILCTARALQQLGAGVQKVAGRWTVIGSGLGGLTQPAGALDFGNSGTGARLMMGAAAGHPLRIVFTGDNSLKKRPMGRVLDPLKKMGLQVEEEGRNTLPLTLIGSAGLVPIEYRLPVPSAQVKSAILIAGVLTAGRTTVIETEKTRDHTEKMLGYFGAAISAQPMDGGMRIAIEGRKALEGRAVTVPGDPSSAAFLAAAAVLCHGSSVLIRDVLVNPTRTGFYQTLIEMGASVSFENERELNGEPVADIRAKASRLRGVRVPAERAPSMIDEYPILAVLAAFAEGTTVMEGLSELRVKESDRLAAMADGLSACGVEAEAHGDTLTVLGSPSVPGGAIIATHMDHRIAMAFIVLGLAAQKPVTVDDASMIATSFPEFEGLMRDLGADLRHLPGGDGSKEAARR